MDTSAHRLSPSTPPAAKSARSYDRQRDLPTLLPLWPAEIADTSDAARLKLLARLRRALRGERKRANAGHWAYDLARHAALLKCYRAEVAAALAARHAEAAHTGATAPPART